MAATLPVSARAMNEGLGKLSARDDYSMVCVFGGAGCPVVGSETLSALCNLNGCKFSGGSCTDSGTLEGGNDLWCNQCHCEED
jgi:hypothetical protein